MIESCTITMNINKLHLGFIILVGLSLLASACSFSGYAYKKQFKIPPPAIEGESYAAGARKLHSESKYKEAIEQYELHIAKRLLSPNRDKEENPYFYYILIGDLYLETNNVEEAKRAYLIARAHTVRLPLVSDRYSKIAHWHDKPGDLETAIEFLKTHRAMDELLFDAETDRLHKKMGAREEQED